MPRYYFDVFSDNTLTRDEIGLDLPDMNAAVAEARLALADMSREAIASAKLDELRILIRDGDDGPVLLTVTISTEWPAKDHDA